MAAVNKKSECWIDPEMVNGTWQCQSNGVKYAMYYDERPPTYIPNDPHKEFGCNMKSYACLAGWKGYLTNKKKKSNRFYYKMELAAKPKPKLTAEEMHEWIRISRENKFLPEYALQYGMLEKKSTVMVIALDDPNLNPPLLYIYLSTLRFIREKPGLVRAIVYLVNEKKMDYYSAMVLASNIVVQHSGHHILNCVKKYGTTGNANMVKVDAKYIVGLYRMVNDPMTYDNRESTDSNGWRCNNQIGGDKTSNGINIKLTAKNLLQPGVSELLRNISMPNSEIQEELKKIIK